MALLQKAGFWQPRLLPWTPGWVLLGASTPLPSQRAPLCPGGDVPGPGAVLKALVPGMGGPCAIPAPFGRS